MLQVSMDYHDEYPVIYLFMFCGEIVMDYPASEKNVKKIGSAGVKRKITKVIDQKTTPWSALLNEKKK